MSCASYAAWTKGVRVRPRTRATARTSTEPNKRRVTTRVIGAADAEARSSGIDSIPPLAYAPHDSRHNDATGMSRGHHVYGNETDFREATGRARGVRWSRGEVSRYRLPSNDSACARLEGVVRRVMQRSAALKETIS
ncbi:hypothetical protein B0H13DRAFT_1921149 [Mycena leptocephala]|nr:hypothetical protein B0H13DRAFT_1921149 [Mycena leptocephala]